MTMPLRIAVLAKQVPRFEELRLGADGRLARDSADAEINPYCRRAIAKGVELARATGGSCTVFTLGPPQAADLLAEAIAWGADEGVLISGRAFAGSDTLATSRALAAAISARGPFGLVLAGLNSVDGDTGQVPPQLAERLDLPFLPGVRELTLSDNWLQVRCERDDGYMTARVHLPTLITAAERLCPPAKVPPAERGDVTGRIEVITAARLGDGPWGDEGSPTQVGEIRPLASSRRKLRLAGPLEQQARDAADLIKQSAERLPRAVPYEHVPSPRTRTSQTAISSAPEPAEAAEQVIAVIAEPGQPRTTRELLGASAQLARALGGRTTLLTMEPADPVAAWKQGADEVIVFGADLASHASSQVGRHIGPVAEDAADAIAAEAAAWATAGTGPPGGPPGGPPERAGSHAATLPWAVLAPSTSWGREVAGRLSVRLDAGLTGDAVGLELADGRLVCWKSAFGGQLVAAITARSAVQMATVRPGVLPMLGPRRDHGAAPVGYCRLTARGRVDITERHVNDEPERLAAATAILCVGKGVDPSRYAELQPLLDALGAELAGTRKVTDEGWLPRSRQVGITGRAVAPAVYLLLGASGKFNHMIGSRGAGLVVAVNRDPDAPVFDAADVGIVADWAQFAPLLAAELGTRSDLVHRDGDGTADDAPSARPQ